MLKKHLTSRLLPVLLITGTASGLIACSGNETSSTFTPTAVIDPIEVDKTIDPLDWDQNNEVEMASHAYRAVAQHSMLATLYTGYSAIFTAFINLVSSSDDINCNSGLIDASLPEKQCKDSNNDAVACKTEENTANPDVAITIEEQKAVFYQCQNGNYFNGPLRVIVKEDYSVDDRYTKTTTISAVAEVSKQGENGKFELDANDDVVKVNATDFLLQNQYNTWLISHEYNLSIEFDNSDARLSSRNITECTTADKTEGDVFKPGTSIVLKEELSSDFVAGLQEPSPQFPYTEFTDLSIVATNSNFRCEDLSEGKVVNESLRYDTTYTLETGIESKPLGKDTQYQWADLQIPSSNEKDKYVEGTITLTHTNADTTDYPVTVSFNGAGGVTVNSGPSMTVSEFLDKSKVVAE